MYSTVSYHAHLGGNLQLIPFLSEERLEVYKVVVGPIDNNVYVIRCSDTGDSILIDAANEHEKLLEISSELKVMTIVETHGHWDHIGAVEQLRNAGYSVGVSQDDAKMLPSYDYLIGDDAEFAVGKLRIRAIKTPGHTPGSVCFSIAGHNILFSGDTLFPGGPGATHFEGGDFPTIINSIETRLFSRFPGQTIVLPGHGIPTTIGQESPKLQEWIARGW
ncbi:MAG: MBL fold metallo-hydrolase [Actinomycetota bacterium]|nr:MAG: MBL fold metallo-hydrolase [Actinomycetota bacterium]